MLTVTDNLPSTLPAPVQDPLLITGTGFTASRREALRVSLLAVPYSETLCWRPPLLPRPKVSGTMTARVTNAKANDIYARQDASGLYRVKFDADREDKGQGQESGASRQTLRRRRVRLSLPADPWHGGGDCFPRRRP